MTAQGSGQLLLLIGVWLYTFNFVTVRFPIGDWGIAISALGLLVQREKLRIPGFLWVFASLILWEFIASFAAAHPILARDTAEERLKVVVIVLLVANAIRTDKQLRLFLLFMLACFLLFPIRGTLTNYVLGIRLFGRAIWNQIYANPNDLAGISLLVFGAALSLALTKAITLWQRRFAILGAILIFTVIMLTQSRGAFIGLVLGFGAPAVRVAFRRPITVFYGIVALIIVAFAVPNDVWQRFGAMSKLTSVSTIAEADSEGSAATRFEIQKTALRIFLDHPVTGVGLGGYIYANAEYAPEIGRKDTHNTYLNLAAELGLPGLLLWVGMVISVLRQARKLRLRLGADKFVIDQLWIERSLWAFLGAGLFGSYSGLTMPHFMLAVLWCSMTMVSEHEAAGLNAAKPKGIR